MRVPLSSERDAFRLAMAVVATTVAAIVLGVLVGALYGAILAGVVIGVGVVAVLAASRREHVPVLAEAASEESHTAARADREQVLVIANVTLDGDELEREIAHDRREQVQVDVLAPVLPSPAKYVTSDVDSARSDARRRLEASLAWAREHRFEARGRVGDDNPIASVADELRFFGADRVIVVTHPPESESRQEGQELDRLRDELDVPVTRVVVG